jgi:hypothetical protein
VAWAGTHGMLAACLNRLGRHAEAKQAITTALANSTPADHRFTGINLTLRSELALAEAGLGNTELAARMADEAFEAYGVVAGPLTRGNLHHLRAALALRAGDVEACERHAQEMERCYLPTAIPSLASFCQSFARERRRALRPLRVARGEAASLSDVSSDIFDGHSFERELSETQGDLHTHAERGLNLLTRSLGQVDGGLFVVREEQTFLVAKLGKSTLPAGMKAWVHTRLVQAQEDDITCTEALDERAAEPDVFAEGAQRFRLFPLSAILHGRPTVVGAVVFAEAPGTRHFVARELLEVFAQRVLFDLEASSVAQLTAAEPVAAAASQETQAEPK